MWFYLYSHCTYHLLRWIPESNRAKFRVIILLVSCAILVPEFIVLSLPKSSRACSQPLLSVLVASMVFLFFAIGFAFIFGLMDPVPRQVKIAFHVYGLGSLVLGIVTSAFAFTAEDCVTSTTELYYWSYTSAVLSLLATGYYFLTVPFWVVNFVWRRSVLNWRSRSGFCFEPVSNCSCIWHI